MKDRSVVIIGGGIAGSAVALFLKRAGFSPRLFEAHAFRSDIGGALQVAPNGMYVLQQLGLAQSLLERGIEGAELCFQNQSGKRLGNISNGPTGMYANPAVHVARSDLHEALLQEVQRQGISIEYSKRLRAISPVEDGVVAEFEDGARVQGSFLVGADGIHSKTRQIVFPEAPKPAYTGLITVGGFASGPGLVPADRRERSQAHMIFGQNGFFGYAYYDRANPMSVMWWSHLQREVEPKADDLSELSQLELQAQMLERYRGWTEPVELIIRSASRVLWGPVYDVPAIPLWWKNRTVLIGDAAHAVSPHAGQGASLALEDALCLAKRLKGSSIEEAFGLFQSDRKGRVDKIAAEARKRGDNKRTITPGEARVRDLIISLFLRFRGSRLNEVAYRYQLDWE